MQTENHNSFLNIREIPFDVDNGIGARARIGIIVLASDHTIEYEFRQCVNIPGVAFYESRIPNSPDITPETLQAMEDHISDRAAVILPGVQLDVIAYCCTSGAMVIGENKVFDRIHDGRPEAEPTTPITAAFSAFKALGIKRIGVLTPYSDEINLFMRAYIENKGFSVPVFGSFNEENDNRAARISPHSIRNAILEIGQHDEVEGVFLSCTSLRLVDSVEKIEQELGKPVTSSNHAIIWHSLRLAGIEEKIVGYGTLFRKAMQPL
jgi:maleate isomerase